MVLVAVLLAGCASTPAEELKDWWGSGGDRSMKALSQTSGRVNEVSARPMDIWGEACQESLAEVTRAKKLGTIPSDDARSFWNDALELRARGQRVPGRDRGKRRAQGFRGYPRGAEGH
ncbi:MULTISPECIES: hypothetical protein [unclassified Streptomyces]|uniref:hypothetical protein n=1 Tax=unclassified Streptomyces TaxID=2593676 RepID=UPI00331F3F2B